MPTTSNSNHIPYGETSEQRSDRALAWDHLLWELPAYCIVWGARATMATAFARDFHTAWPCFERARMAFADLGLSEFHHERRFGGRGTCALWHLHKSGAASSWERRRDYRITCSASDFAMRWVVGAGDVHRRVQRIYSLTPVHRAPSPLAQVMALDRLVRTR